MHTLLWRCSQSALAGALLRGCSARISRCPTCSCLLECCCAALLDPSCVQRHGCVPCACSASCRPSCCQSLPLPTSCLPGPQADAVDIAYPPLVQSGGEYDLRLASASKDSYIHYGVIVCSLGAR